MTQERIAFFEKVLSKPIAEPHRSYIEELFAEARGKTEKPKPLYSQKKQAEPVEIDRGGTKSNLSNSELSPSEG